MDLGTLHLPHVCYHDKVWKDENTGMLLCLDNIGFQWQFCLRITISEHPILKVSWGRERMAYGMLAHAVYFCVLIEKPDH